MASKTKNVKRRGKYAAHTADFVSYLGRHKFMLLDQYSGDGKCLTLEHMMHGYWQSCKRGSAFTAIRCLWQRHFAINWLGLFSDDGKAAPTELFLIFEEFVCTYANVPLLFDQATRRYHEVCYKRY